MMSVEIARKVGQNTIKVDHCEGDRLAFEKWMEGHCWKVAAYWDGKGYVGVLENDLGIVEAEARLTRMLWAAWRDAAATVRMSTVEDGI